MGGGYSGGVLVHATWLTLLERYQKIRPPMLTNVNDGVLAKTWKKNVIQILIVLDAIPV